MWKAKAPRIVHIDRILQFRLGQPKCDDVDECCRVTEQTLKK